MRNSQATVKCAECGTPIDESRDPPEHRTPCANCGSTHRHLSVSVTIAAVAYDGLGVKGKRSDQKRPYFEEFSRPEYQRNLQKTVHRQRSIDRDQDKYAEKITDYDTGEIIHHCEEPLSHHRGHGSAKQRTKSE
jgi:hypothetical protein